MRTIKVRKVNKVNFFDMILVGRSYYLDKMEKVRRLSLPDNGDKIMITWLPDNKGIRNAYIGIRGVVEYMDKTTGNFILKSDSAVFSCSGDFDYIKV